MQKYLFFVIYIVIYKFRQPFPKDYEIENRKEMPILIIVTMSNVHILWLVFIRDYDINKTSMNIMNYIINVLNKKQGPISFSVLS